MDKPHITVSGQPATRGHIYFSYRQAGGALVMRKYGNTGWSAVSTISNVNAGLIFGVQMVVSPYSGNLYAFWTDFTDDRIKWARSSNQGTTWSGAANFSNANNLVRGYLVGGNIRAPSFPIIRFNWVGIPRISVVWHECSIPPLGTFASLDCTADSNVYYASLGSSGSTNKVRIDDSTQGDQFLPAVDFDVTGNLVSTFYDTRLGGSGYHLYRAYINSGGSTIVPNADVSLANSATGTAFIGDYHEVWSTTVNGISTWIASWSRVGSPNQDIFLSPLTP